MTTNKIKIPVLKVKQPIGDFYIASIKAQDLVDITFSDVREMVGEGDIDKYLGIQREVSSARVKEIKRYVKGRDATFPTAVIVAIDEKCAAYESHDDNNVGLLTITPYEPEEGSDDEAIPFKKVAKVIDGQHRIAAFIDDLNNWTFDFGDDDFDINVSIFVGADISEQANIFATVNLAQTKVNKSLVYDLTELAETRSPFKTCHNVAVMLDKEDSSPLYQRIKRLGVKTPGRSHEPLTQAAFVEALVKFISSDPVSDRNLLLDGKKLPFPTEKDLEKNPFRKLFIEEKDLDIAEILYNYFMAVKQKWPQSWDNIQTSGNLLPKSNAFKAFMKFLKNDVYLELVNGDIGRIPSTEQFYEYFKPIGVEDKDFTTRNFAPGSGGESRFLKMLRQEISIEDMLQD